MTGELDFQEIAEDLRKNLQGLVPSGRVTAGVVKHMPDVVCFRWDFPFGGELLSIEHHVTADLLLHTTLDASYIAEYIARVWRHKHEELLES